ncbi:MAG: class I SAM-dependent DNA methyltransferase [Verrucomicrobiota bacterium]
MSETLNTSDALSDYYNKRAQEYEQIYAKPERQEALGKLKAHLREILRGHDVLEIACGTGYWTEVIASIARSVLATDISEEMLSIARQKNGKGFAVEHFQRPLSDYFNVLTDTGFVVKKMIEPPINRRVLKVVPRYAEYLDRPIGVIFYCNKES